ncbi:MAG: tetratricopeptide repeat protein [Gammaproteobacteria bacterium]|nr:tetratricopeptide repeat protein [Gammaproteobacteria bacterium]
MEGYVSDKEQIQLIKDWWKKHGTTILIAIVLVVGLSSGWRFWQSYKAKHAAEASVLYEQLLTAGINNKSADMKLYTDHLRKDYKHTPYASLASLMLAKADVATNNLGDAQKDLAWVVKHGKPDSIQQIARLREARVLLANNKAKQALKLLDKVDDKAFMPAISEARGDIYASQGNKAKALQQYKISLQESPKNSVLTPALQMKINQLKGNIIH